MISRKVVLYILSISAIVGCREEFDPKVSDYEELLVVDGFVTNEQGPYTVKLSLTSSLEEPDLNPLSGCRVMLEEKDGQYEVLKEKEPGTYKSSAGGFQASAGESYKLTIETPGGQLYHSDFIEMKQPVAIDTSTVKLRFRESPEYPEPLGAYHFFVSTREAEQNNTFFLWRISETYEYTSEFRILYIYRGMGVEAFYNRDSLYRCWKTQNVKEFFVGTTQGLTTPRIRKEPIHVVTTEGKRLQVRYSWQIKQYNISREAYEFWKEVRNQTAGDDFLFSTQPYQLRGNVYNVNNPEEAVMGFFTVGSVTRKRFFVDRPDARFYYQKCVPNPDLRALMFMPPEQYPVYLTNTNEGRAFASDYCFDCTLWGGQLEPPEFWVEHKTSKNTRTEKIKKDKN